MRLHFLQHVEFEGPAFISAWASAKRLLSAVTRPYKGDPMPGMDDFDCLIIMGGPMSVGDEDHHPWLITEKRFIEEAISSGKIVMGICLGAQLIACVLGAAVRKNEFKEIGRYPVKLTAAGRAHSLFSTWPQEFMALHWHGDTFDIPAGAILTASSVACRNQSFVYGDRVIGLQFHLEATAESENALIDNCGRELVKDDFIQSRDEILASSVNIPKENGLMAELLAALAELCNPEIRSSRL